jgi:hypothetical protein
MAVSQHSVKIVKEFTYRGVTQQWSNKYFFNGAVPADWDALFDALVALEKTCYSDSVTIIGAHGYAPGSDVAVANKAYTTAGTLATTGAQNTPGDCAVVLRMATTKVSTKNHVVYVFSYYHRAFTSSGTASPDLLLASQKTAVEAFGTNWLDGFVVGGRTFKRTTPDGHLVTGRHVDQYIGHRDFPR